MKKIFFNFTFLTLLAGCAGDGFRNSVGDFSKATVTVSDTQKQRLSDAFSIETERARVELARSRDRLQLSSECAILLADPKLHSRCRVIDSKQEAIEDATGGKYILKLGTALRNYSAALGDLATTTVDDSEAFRQAASGLAVSLGNLDKEIADAAQSDTRSPEELGVIAGVLGELGTLYFDFQRVAALRRIIVRTDPLIQTATSLLSEAARRVRLALLNQELTGATTAQTQLHKLIDAKPAGDIMAVRKAQDTLFEKVAALKSAASSKDDFTAIGEAHAKLRERAEGKASVEDIRAAIERLILSGQNIQAVTKQKVEEGGS